ncbi:hypothetical protein DQ354_12375 [Arthrobacter sp. AQ5-06]|nr:hypothetical protein DQ354_12375 [Arthrobacter sp. AQ5-06]
MSATPPPVWVVQTANSPPGTDDFVVKVQDLVRAQEPKVVLGDERRSRMRPRLRSDDEPERVAG